MNGTLTAKEATTEGKSTNVGQFLAKRGVILVKEMRDILSVKGEYGGKINVATVILSSAKSTLGDVQFGVKLDHIDEHGDTRGSGFLDYDELDELIGAFDFVDDVASQMMGQLRDYTEVTYSTKDNMRFGFYQSERQQQAFIDVGGYGDSLFLSLPRLKQLQKSIEAAKSHLLSRGAESNPNESQTT